MSSEGKVHPSIVPESSVSSEGEVHPSVVPESSVSSEEGVPELRSPVLRRRFKVVLCLRFFTLLYVFPLFLLYVCLAIWTGNRLVS